MRITPPGVPFLAVFLDMSRGEGGGEDGNGMIRGDLKECTCYKLKSGLRTGFVAVMEQWSASLWHRCATYFSM